MFPTMFLPKSTRSVTGFDELAVRRDAAALRARFLRSYALGAWNALRRLLSRPAPHAIYNAREVQVPRRQWFSEASAGSWTTAP